VGKKSVEYPLKLFLFEVVMLDGKNLISMPFSERRKKLESLIKPNDTILLSEMKIVKTEKELSDFFEEKISQGLEGIMAKDLNAKYTAGARKFAWIKLKRSVKGELKDTIDAVVIGYYSGKGKRTEFGLGALLVAAYNSEKDSFESLAKIGTGMKEIDLSELEEELSKMRVKKKPARVDSSIESDFWVEPRMVVELNADEITKSPSHECAKSIKGFGLALRFPRLLKKRMDKKAEDSTTNIEIAGMFDRQKRVLLQEPVEE
jgi:DNA ligase-1